MSNKDIIIYSKSNCIYCNKAKSLLKNLNVEYTEKTLESFESPEAMLEDIGKNVRQMPQIKIDGDLLRKFVDAGVRTKKDDFTKDLAIVIDSIRGLLYRDFEMAHPAQLLGANMVTLKTMKNGTHKSAKIDYSRFLDKPKDTKSTQALSKDIKEELNFLQEGGDIFTPDDDQL